MSEGNGKDNGGAVVPSPNGGTNGHRNELGQFVKGNPGGPGNPNCKHLYKCRAAYNKKAQPRRIGNIGEAMLRRAERGDFDAMKYVLDRSLGRAPMAGDDEGPDVSVNVFAGLEITIVRPGDVNGGENGNGRHAESQETKPS